MAQGRWSLAVLLLALLLVAPSLPGLGAQSPAPVSGGRVDPKLIEDLVLANKILAVEGVVDSQGHVSMRHPTNPNRYLMSRARAPELVTVEDVMEHDLDGNVVEARDRAPYLERFIHGEVYRARPDVMSVVHNHSPSVIPFTVSSVPLRTMAHSGAFIGSGLPIFEIRKVGGMTDMLVSNPALGRAFAQALGQASAILMRGHGAATVGPDLRRAVGRAVYLEVNAKLQLQAIGLGGTVTYFEAEEARLVEARRDYDRQWELWTRKVNRGN